MKPLLKLKIIDWWDDEFEENYFVQFLSQKYQIIQSDKPDYVLCSIFGDNHLKYNCVKIFFTGEDIIPDFNLYDYALGFCNLNFSNRYLRFPLPLLYSYQQKPIMQIAQNKHKHITTDLYNRKFCSFVVSNKYGHPIRENFFKTLSKYKFVASGGKFQNNIGSPILDKHSFISSYKFNIAFENSKSPHYCTEKLIEAFCAKTIPIYWGDPNLYEWVNPKSLINLSDFSSINEAIRYILHLDSNPQAYLNTLQEKAFLFENLQQSYEKKLLDFFDFIFSQPLHQAYKKQENLTYWQKRRYATMEIVEGGGAE